VWCGANDDHVTSVTDEASGNTNTIMYCSVCTQADITMMDLNELPPELNRWNTFPKSNYYSVIQGWQNNNGNPCIHCDLLVDPCVTLWNSFSVQNICTHVCMFYLSKIIPWSSSSKGLILQSLWTAISCSLCCCLLLKLPHCATFLILTSDLLKAKILRA